MKSCFEEKMLWLQKQYRKLEIALHWPIHHYNLSTNKNHQLIESYINSELLEPSCSDEIDQNLHNKKVIELKFSLQIWPWVPASSFYLTNKYKILSVISADNIMRWWSIAYGVQTGASVKNERKKMNIKHLWASFIPSFPNASGKSLIFIDSYLFTFEFYRPLTANP